MVEAPDPELLPSVGALVRSSIAAAALVAALAITVVLPAERGVDPTGLGAVLGLTQMTQATSPAAPTQDFAFRTEELRVELGPREGLEVKVSMREGDELLYSWTSANSSVHYEFHGEPAGAPQDVFTSYDKGQARAHEGDLIAPFEGNHGWYWKNLRSSPTTVTVQVTGVFRDLREL